MKNKKVPVLDFSKWKGARKSVQVATGPLGLMLIDLDAGEAVALETVAEKFNYTRDSVQKGSKEPWRA